MSHIAANWPEVLLRNVCTSKQGLTFTPDQLVPKGTSESIACFRTKNIQGNLDDHDLIFLPKRDVAEEILVREGDVLVSTANSGSLVGKCCLVGALGYQATYGGFLALLRPDSSVVCPAFFHAWLASDTIQARLRGMARQTTNIANLPSSEILRLEFPLPPLSEQRRIVEILREAEAARHHQAQAARTASELIPSLLSDAYSKTSAKTKISTFFATPPNYGTMTVATDSVEGVPCIRVGNIRNNAFVPDGIKKVPADEISDERHRVKSGDLVLVRAIGSLDHLGKCFVVTDEMNGWAFDSHLMRVRLKPELPAHLLHAFFSAPEGRRAFLAKARKSAVQYNINAGEFASIEIPAFDRRLRNLIDHAITTYESHRVELARSAEKTNELHAALLAHAFGGSLTQSWREQNAALLATETAVRDASLTVKKIKTATVGAAVRPVDEDQASIYATPMDGAWTDLTARQRALWRYVRTKGAFGVSDLLHARAKEPLLMDLSEDGFRRELEVFVARGALVQVSRPQIASKDERDVFRHYYRKVSLPENEATWNAASVKAIAASLRTHLIP